MTGYLNNYCLCSFRDGCDWLFEQLYKDQVPLLVLSAGIGDVIEAVIRQQVKLYDNVKVVANYMEFNEQVIHFFYQQIFEH